VLSGGGRSVPPVSAPRECPGCASQLLQPLRCQPRDGGEALVELRCPDCDTWVQDTLSVAELRELDARQAALRTELLALYERTVAEAMEALAVCLGRALELDLVGADDFARPAA
jgi:hypothetical protein